MSGLKITIARKSGAKALNQRLAKVQRMAAYVGIPAANANTRSAKLLAIASQSTGGEKRKRRALAQALKPINNAELLFVQSKGSPARGIPARPVLEPAIEADGNREPIAHELAESAKATLHDQPAEAKKRLKRAAMAGQNAARRWFSDQRNQWAPNAPSTIRRKGSDKPLIDFGLMRGAIVGITREE
jgi:hypothetical protein